MLNDKFNDFNGLKELEVGQEMLNHNFLIVFLVRKWPSRSAPGPDNVSNTVIKHSGKKSIIFLCGLFNLCTRLKYFPKVWKTAAIVMLPKPGKDPLLPSNHKPILLLDSMGKTHDKLLLNRLKTYILPVIRPEQFASGLGTRPLHSLSMF